MKTVRYMPCADEGMARRTFRLNKRVGLPTMKTYDVLVTSLHRSYRRNTTRWVRGIRAPSLGEACRMAQARHPNLGLTPTAVSMAWPVHPQPKELA